MTEPDQRVQQTDQGEQEEQSQPNEQQGQSSSLSLLRDNIWQFVGVLVAVAAIVAGYQVFFAQRPVRRLEVVVLANTSLVEIEPDAAEKIKIYYEDRVIDNLSLVQVRLENTGNRAIRVEDYERHLAFVFPEGAEIVEGAVVESEPPNIGILIDVDENVGRLEPALLNPDDRAIIRFLLINMPSLGGDSPFQLDARLAEVKAKDIRLASAIDQLAPGAELGLASPFVSANFIVLGAFYLLLAYRRRDLPEPTRKRQYIFAGLIIAAGFAFLVITVRRALNLF